ncbi:psbP domain-containing protein 1, chloroplastic isoform X2 [Vigna radiata var. radiata]|uniref:PsbP domain-containing protein 1, chloroplastic isoform X2 n=1 Tax=Vigna radiata var. radiata TaxID=3916 RepID=A0A1S3TQ25_VIGRR|nr:psbP domain-containing protein 1, chloroplastic isoform X2 [Vigna radiata var. radiata]
MARLAAIQEHLLSCSPLTPSLSDLSGTRLHTQHQLKRKLWQQKGTLYVSASSTKKIFNMGGIRFIGVFLSRLLVKEGHRVTLFTRGKAPVTQQLPGESDGDYAVFSSKILHSKGDRKDFEFEKSSLSAEEFDVICVNGREADEVEPVFDALPNLEQVSRRKAASLILSTYILSKVGIALAQQSPVFREYIDAFDGYSFQYPRSWIQVRGAGADIFFRDPYVLDENLSLEISSPSSSQYKSVEDLGPPQEAGKKVLKQYLTEFMSTRLGVRRESNILSTSSRVADDGKLYYEVEVNIKSYANNNELAVMPQDRVARLEWDRRYLSVLGVENNQLYELRLQVPENVFAEEESDLRRVMDSFRVSKIAA